MPNLRRCSTAPRESGPAEAFTNFHGRPAQHIPSLFFFSSQSAVCSLPCRQDDAPEACLDIDRPLLDTHVCLRQMTRTLQHTSTTTTKIHFKPPEPSPHPLLNMLPSSHDRMGTCPCPRMLRQAAAVLVHEDLQGDAVVEQTRESTSKPSTHVSSDGPMR